MSQFERDSAFARVLNRILSEGRFTAIELAIEAECSDRQILYVASGERDLAAHKAERIARYLCRHGDTRLASVFLDPEHTIVQRAAGVADGSIQDELIAIVEALGDASRAHGVRDAARLDAALTQIRARLADLDAERAQLA